MSYDPRAEFYVPGTFDPSETWPANERTLHEGGLDQIDPASDYPTPALAGAYGFDPQDVYAPSLNTRQDIEGQLPQWGPPFVKFVDERISQLEKQIDKAIEKWSYKDVTIVDVNSFNSDASGNVGANQVATLLEPPVGFTLGLHRISIFPDGSTFGTPFTAAGSYWTLRINGEDIEGGSMVSGVGSLPIVRTWGTRDALRIRDGEILSFFMSAGPVSKRITVKCQATMERVIEG